MHGVRMCRGGGGGAVACVSVFNKNPLKDAPTVVDQTSVTRLNCVSLTLVVPDDHRRPLHLLCGGLRHERRSHQTLLHEHGPHGT